MRDAAKEVKDMFDKILSRRLKVPMYHLDHSIGFPYERTEDADFEIIEPKQLLPMSNLQCIAEHTIDLSLLTRNSKVLDLGCHKFGWAKAMLEFVDGIMCIDADDIQEPEDDRINFIQGVVCIEPLAKFIQFVKYGNGTGNYIYNGGKIPEGGKLIDVLSLNLNEVFEIAGKPDLIKFDIEGAEVPVILALTEPPAKQLSIEWHKHTGTTETQIIECFEHLFALGYELVFQDYSRKHGLQDNYWDTLFILK